MLLARSGAERFRMATSMFDTCRTIMRAQIAHLPEVEQRVELFRRTYGADFDAAARARIEAWLRGAQPVRGSDRGAGGEPTPGTTST